MSADPTKFSPQFQTELMQHIVHVPGLYKQVSGVIKITDWVMPSLQFMYSAYEDAAKLADGSPSPALYARHLSEAVSARRTSVSTLMEGEVDSVCTAYAQIITPPTEVITKYLLNQLSTHLQYVRVWQLQGMAFNLADPATLKTYLAGMAEVGKLPAAVSTGGIQFDSAWGSPSRMLAKVAASKVRTGLRAWDIPMGGGHKLGNTGMVVACPGIGKTNALLNINWAAASGRRRGLCITGELQADRLKHRYQCMDAAIPGSLIVQPQYKWPSDVLRRFDYIQGKADKNAFLLWDGSNQRITLSMIDRVIEAWKRNMLDIYGSEEEAKADVVTADWLDYFYPDVMPKDGKKDERLIDVIKGLGTIFRRYGVAGWTAHQGNRSAMNREILTMDNTAGAFLINQATDVSVGLAPVQSDSFTKQGGEVRVDYDRKYVVADTDDNEESEVFIDCNRQLSTASMKHRDGAFFHKKVYQGPTLKFWDSRGMYDYQQGELDRREWDTLLPMSEAELAKRQAERERLKGFKS